MIIPLTGKVKRVKVETSKAGKTSYIVLVEDTSEEKQRLIGVKCWSDDHKLTAQSIRPGDLVTVKFRPGTMEWTPKTGGEPVLFHNHECVQIAVTSQGEVPSAIDDDPPF